MLWKKTSNITLHWSRDFDVLTLEVNQAKKQTRAVITRFLIPCGYASFLPTNHYWHFVSRKFASYSACYTLTQRCTQKFFLYIEDRKRWLWLFCKIWVLKFLDVNVNHVSKCYSFFDFLIPKICFYRNHETDLHLICNCALEAILLRRALLLTWLN